MQLNYLCNKEHKMQEFNEEFDFTCDICVVGLGTAGAIAAIAAAKKGATVIGIEKQNIMGGSGTGGGVYDYFFGNRGGLYEEINKECFEMQEKGYLSTDRFHNKGSIPGAVKAEILERNALKYGCRIFYETSITGAMADCRHIRGVQIFSDGKFINIGARVVLDCTGEAFLCRMCGCEMMPGRMFDNQLMRFSKPVGMLYEGYMVAIWNNYDFTDLTSAEIYSKKALESMIYTVALRDEYSNDGRVMFESNHIGMRECMCVKCEETLTFAEYVKNKRIKQPLFYGFAPLDNTNHDVVFESDESKDWFVLSELSDYGFSVPVSARMMIPKGYDGLMIAAKGIGIGHDMSGLLRMKRDMEKCGEAAAAVAVYAAKNNLSPKDVPYERIIDELKESGCYQEENNLGLRRIRAAQNGEWKNKYLPIGEEKIKQVLSSDCPGTAFWKIRVSNREEMCEMLKEMLKSSDKTSSKNAAFALGMIGDASGVEIIREILKYPAEMPKKIYSVRYYTDLSKAIILAGRLCDEESIPYLENIVRTDARGYADGLEFGEYYKNKEAFESNFTSLAVLSLMQITESADKTTKGKIMSLINEWIKKAKKNKEEEKIRKVFFSQLCEKSKIGNPTKFCSDYLKCCKQ